VKTSWFRNTGWNGKQTISRYCPIFNYLFAPHSPITVFRHGFQHVVPKPEVNIKSIHGTMIIWLQNDAGYQKWQPTEVRSTPKMIPQ
jgi:hypothetical protein